MGQATNIRSEEMAEEFRDDKKLMIAADVPGLRPDRDISVSINSDILHIRAGQGDVWVPETDLREGEFSRSIRLPSGADADNGRATYIDGILEVEVPMREFSSTTRIVPITRGTVGSGEEGWYIDPFQVHERRWFSEGTPTKLVSDGGVTSTDPAPDAPCPRPLVQIPDSEGLIPDRVDLHGDADNDDGVTGAWEAFVETGGD